METKFWLSVLIPAIILGGISVGIFGYNTFVKQPRLTYELLAPYPVEEGWIALVVIRNEGAAVATNVKIIIDTVAPIRNLIHDSREDLTLEGTNSTRLIVHMPRLVQNVTVPFYLRVNTNLPSAISEIFIASNEGPGAKRASSSPLPSALVSVTSISVGLTLIFAVMWYQTRRRLYELQKRYGSSSE